MKSLKTKIILNTEKIIYERDLSLINYRIRYQFEDAIVSLFRSNRPQMQIFNQTYKIRIPNDE